MKDKRMSCFIRSRDLFSQEISIFSGMLFKKLFTEKRPGGEKRLFSAGLALI